MISLKRKRFWASFFAAILIAILGSALLVDIATKKKEAVTPYTHAVVITDDTTDPAQWGINFPHHFASYTKTVDQTRTKYGGSEAVSFIPTEKDPRTQVAQSRLDEDPRLKTIWAGYAFATDFREERGHAYMFIDQLYTKRQEVVKQPGTCLNCHASTYTLMKNLGSGDIQKGFHEMNKLPYFEVAKQVKHPVSCIDCHTPTTMKLRITRPAFVTGIAQVKALEGKKNYDVNKMATPQEMRTFVCAQCHVEYYFKGADKTLTYPWSKGLKVDQILSYYDEDGHKDWKHKITQADVLKAQHPEFEMYSQGIHARSGVSCTDCHMPYMRVGAMKITDHHVRSPLLNISHSCQTCHRWPEPELKARVEQIQDRTFQMRNIAMDALVEYINQLGSSSNKLSPETRKKAHDYQKRAQFLLDFVEAENSMGFHAPGESLRLLGISIDYTRKGQMLLKSSSPATEGKK